MEKIGKYEIVKQLGQGATSTVYLALDPFSKQQVAIKLIDLNALHDPAQGRVYRKLLMTEASLAGKLQHPHIVRILDAVLEQDVDYMVMEYVDGDTLERYGVVDHLLPVKTVAEIIYKGCKALEYAQSQGVIHRDIKPANILLRGESDIKISDFGAAVIQNAQTTQVVGVGSPAYMSPEQVKELSLTHQTDIYSLGVVMYKLLCGKLPFEAGNNFSMIYHIINIEPPPPSLHRPDLPQEVDVIVQKAMAKDTAARYQTWAEFAHDLLGLFEHDVEEPGQSIYDSEKFDLMRGLSFFRQFSDVTLWEVLRVSRWQRAGKASTILREGDAGRTFFILAQGTVRIVKRGRLLSLLHQGDCFGEMAHLSGQDARRSTDVIAKSDVVLIEIDPVVLAQASDGCRFQFSDAFLRMLAQRLAMANTRISYLLADESEK